MRRLFVLTALLFALPAHALEIDWVTVGDPGNACDPQSDGCYGAVDYTYRIGKYEVTNAQYAEFLNAVAADDTYGLYEPYMAYPPLPGITRSGSSGSYTYSVTAGREVMPVHFVSFWNAVRFTNWLHNGQPTGAQGNTTTEDGAYTLDGYTGLDGSWINRNPGATVFVPSEDEWYKAAYYDAVSTSYFDYPAGTDTPTTCAVPGATANTANCGLPPVVGDFTDVGSYTGSASPYGTFDQGGNASEWQDTNLGGGYRGLRGGAFYFHWIGLAASYRNSHLPWGGDAEDLGFRVAMIPEPGTALLLAFGLAGLAAAGRGRSLH